MVFPTSHTGITGPAGQNEGQGQAQVPQVPKRFPEVYASVRVVKNWELMKISQETCKDDAKSMQLAYDLLNKERVNNLFRDYSVSYKGKMEGMYQVLLAWKEWRDGMALVGDVAKCLRKHGFRDLAESFPP